MDWNSYRKNIENGLTEILGHDVEIKGPISVQFLPQMNIEIEDLKIGGPQDDKTEISKVSANLNFLHFIFGRINLEAITIDHIQTRLRIDERGNIQHDDVIDYSNLIGEQTNKINIIISETNVLLERGDHHDPLHFKFINFETTLQHIDHPIRLKGTLDHLGTPYEFKASFDSLSAEQSRRSSIQVKSQDHNIVVAFDGVLNLRENWKLEGLTTIRHDGTDAKLVGSDRQDRVLTALPDLFPKNAYFKGKTVFDAQSLVISAFEFKPHGLAELATFSGSARIDFYAKQHFNIIATSHNFNFGLMERKENLSLADLNQSLGHISYLLNSIGAAGLSGRLSLDADFIKMGSKTIRDFKSHLNFADHSWHIEALDAKLPGQAMLGLKFIDSIQGQDPSAKIYALTLNSDLPKTFLGWATNVDMEAVDFHGSASLNAEISTHDHGFKADNIQFSFDNSQINGAILFDKNKTNQLFVELNGKHISRRQISVLQNLVRLLEDNGDPIAQSRHYKIDFQSILSQKMPLDRLQIDAQIEKQHLVLQHISAVKVGHFNFSGKGRIIRKKGHIAQEKGHIALEHGGSSTDIILDLKAGKLADLFLLANDYGLPQLSAFPKISEFLADESVKMNIHLLSDETQPDLYTIATTGHISGAEIKLNSTIEQKLDDIQLHALNLNLKHGDLKTFLEKNDIHLPWNIAGQGAIDVEILQADHQADTTETGPKHFLLSTRLDHKDFAVSAKGNIFDILIPGVIFEGDVSLQVKNGNADPFKLMQVLDQGNFPYILSAKANYSTNILSLKELKTDPALLHSSSQIQLDFNSDIPTVQAKIKSPTLSLSSILGSFILGQSLQGDAPIDIGYRRLPFNGEVAFQSVKEPRFLEIALPRKTNIINLKFSDEDIAADFTLKNDDEALNGTAKICCRQDQAHYHMSVAGEMSNIDLTRLNSTISAIKNLSGELSGQFKLDAVGATANAFMETLSGQGELNSKNLTINHFNPDAVNELPNLVKSEQSNTIQSLESNFHTQLFSQKWISNHAIMPYQIAGGKIRSDEIKLTHQQTSLDGNVQIDVQSGQLNGQFSLSTKAQDNHLPAIDLQVDGTLSNPETSAKTTNLIYQLVEDEILRHKNAQ